jgi:methyl-accepting chemotaxis protein
MRTRRHAVTYAVWGALAGALFFVVGAGVEAARRPEVGAGAAGLLRVVEQTPLLWIVGTAPLFLGLLAGFAGQRQDQLAAIDAARRDGFLKTASELFTAAQSLLSTVSSFSSMTAGTAASVRETTATMGQLGHTATQAALTAETVIGLARRGERASAEGLASVEACLTELRKVADEVRGFSQRMAMLDGRMHEVLEAAAMVGRVAERSQRLAEAAEAEARRGGPASVGLEEVAAALRQQSEDASLASARVQAGLAEVHDSVRAALTAADGGRRRVEQGADVASGAGETIERLTRALRDASDAAREIAAVAQQQDRGIDQVLRSMNEIYLATQESMTSTQAVATEAKALNDLASGLKRAVES